MIKRRIEKSVNLALQGGGAHGAFTWGVLDRLFEDDRIWIQSLSGTSAGAMNAVVAAQGMTDGQAEGARRALHDFWRAVSEAGKTSPVQRTPLDMLMGNWNLDNSPSFIFSDLMQRVSSPYDVNPLNYNPLRKIVEDRVDFSVISKADDDFTIFISATNVETGRARIFHRHELSVDVVLASACLPFMFQAVEIEGEHYWDGGYMGNPVLSPFTNHSHIDDILIVQINPIRRDGVPTTAREILNRVNEISFNSSLMRELFSIYQRNQLINSGELDKLKHRSIRVHMIKDRDHMLPLSASTKLLTEWPFLLHLFEIGRSAASRWLNKHYDKLGTQSSLDLGELFQGDQGVFGVAR